MPRWAPLPIYQKVTVAALGVLFVGGIATGYAMGSPGRAHPLATASPGHAVGITGRRITENADSLITGVLAPTATPAPAATPRPIPPPPPPMPYEAGVNVLVYGNDAAFSQEAAAQLDHLVALHVNSVSIVFPIYTASYTATTVYADPAGTPSTDKIRLFIRLAHQRHLRVMVRPLLDEVSLHPAGRWRGQLAPSNVGAWFTSYRSLMVGYAQAAQGEGAEIVDVGTEFDSLQPYTDAWLELIDAVRRVFHGLVTYSDNWPVPYPDFGYAVDFLSIDAFYPLAAPANATQQQLVNAWSGSIGHVDYVGYLWGKHVVFTELGTTAEVGSFRQPWVWNHNTGLSLEAQRLYYAATCQALRGRISGIYWWEYLLQPLPSPSSDPSYDPEGKPADVEIGRCFA